MAPAIKVSLTNPITRAHISFEGFLDTGFDGIILIPWDTYLELGLRKCELPRKLWSMGVSVTGEVPLRAAHVELEMNGMKKRVVAETFRGNLRKLIGGGYIEEHITTLNGPCKLLEIKSITK